MGKKKKSEGREERKGRGKYGVSRSMKGKKGVGRREKEMKRRKIRSVRALGMQKRNREGREEGDKEK